MTIHAVPKSPSRKNVLPFQSFLYRLYCACVIGYWGGLFGFDGRYHGSPAMVSLKNNLGIPWDCFGVLAIAAAVLILGPPVVRVVGWSLCLVMFIVLMYALLQYGWTHPHASLNGGTTAAVAVAIGAACVGIWNSARLMFDPNDQRTPA